MGLIARSIEEHGIATVCIILQHRDVAEVVKPPRSLFLPFPFGAPLGPADDLETQMAVITEALAVLTAAAEPGVIKESRSVWPA